MPFPWALVKSAPLSRPWLSAALHSNSFLFRARASFSAGHLRLSYSTSGPESWAISLMGKGLVGNTMDELPTGSSPSDDAATVRG
jgi:hypothetical protein